MVVVAIIAIVAAVAIPGMLRARITSNESSAIGSLRTIATAQTQFLSNVIVDQDQDGSGEYGLLTELAGATNTRGGSQMKPGFVPSALGEGINTTNQSSQKAGYRYRVYLPGGIDTGSDPGSATDSNVIDGQETHFRAYAWPHVINNTGNRAFAIDQGSETFFSRNNGGSNYSGLSTTPSFDSASQTAVSDTLNGFEANFSKGIGHDGQRWTPAGG